MRKIILPIALAATSFAAAADIEIHGNVDFDFASYFDKDFDPTNAANQDIDLYVKANLDENVSVTVYTNTKSNVTNADQSAEIRHGLARSTAINSADDRYTAFNFDGVELRWTPFQDVSLVFGDLTYNAGAFNYYFWRDPSRYAAIARNHTVRGIGVEVGNEKFGDGKVYIGATEESKSAIAVFATYGLKLLNRPDEHLTITPSVDWVFGSEIGRGYTYFFGTELDYSKSLEVFNYSVYAAYGLHPYKGKAVHSFLVEPSLNYDFFNLGLNYFYAIVNKEDDYKAADQIFTDDQMLFAVEPSFNITKKFSLGVSFEYHDPDSEIKDDEFEFLGMNFYLYPTINTNLVFWFGYNFSEDKNPVVGKSKFALGMSAHAEF
ncbi:MULTISPECIES: hypothetical protein [Fibrobacter]|uniref:hypothetical protein n=1 Tax=Fibrobacter TaxID=832 RepID=UPI000B528511|nr:MULTISPECIES: hypothetical protein [Fibrobacter]MBO4827944.1 hypothetical protein [Fibrobacter sp.]OWV18441.1 hypothetical protein B7990_08020 [Fibrobacter sp. UWB4]